MIHSHSASHAEATLKGRADALKAHRKAVRDQAHALAVERARLLLEEEAARETSNSQG